MSPVSTPRVIAHRGASGERPEHTRSAYALAVEQGADGLEVDVVSTRDGVLVCRHEHQISGTTDVAEHPELADRRTTRTVPGRAEATGWFVEDLTYAELRSLRARERMPKTRPGSAAYDGLDLVPTLAEVLDLVAETRRTRPFSLWVELKHPSYLESLGLGLVEPVLAALADAGLEGTGSDGQDADVVLESFEPTILTALSERTDLPLMQLLELADKQPADLAALGDARTFGDLTGHAALDEMAPRIAMLGVHTTHVFPVDPGGRDRSALVARRRRTRTRDGRRGLHAAAGEPVPSARPPRRRRPGGRGRPGAPGARLRRRRRRRADHRPPRSRPRRAGRPALTEGTFQDAAGTSASTSASQLFLTSRHDSSVNVRRQ